MFDDDKETAKAKAAIRIGEDLSEFSVDELASRIEFLKQEIQRLSDIMGDKSRHLEAASALFKK